MKGIFILSLILLASLAFVSANSLFSYTGQVTAGCGNGVLDSGELCDNAAPLGENNAYGDLCNSICQVSGSSNGAVQCRGHGVSVCVEKVPSDYFENNPLCIPNYACGGQYYRCNDLCPLPTSTNGTGGGGGGTNQTNTTCADDCSFGTRGCSGNYAQICANYDLDDCWEWNTGTYCTYGCSGGYCLTNPGNQTNQTSCTDSDGGKDYYVKGTVTIPSLKMDDSCVLSFWDASRNEWDYKDVSFCPANSNNDPQVSREDRCLIGELYCSSTSSIPIDNYYCPNGCKDGACLKEAPAVSCITNADCSSSYSRFCNEEGSVCESGTFSECIEGVCVERGGYGGCYPICNNGCENAECIIEEYTPYSCNSLIEEVKDPKEFSIYDVTYTPSKYTHVREDTFYINNVDEPAVTYSGSWYGYQTDRYYSLNYDVSVFKNKDVNLGSWIKDELSRYNLCTLRSFYVGDKEQKVYLCSWAFENEDLNVDRSQNKFINVLWPSANVLVQIGTQFGEYLTEEEALLLSQERIADFLNSLRDNSYDYSWDNYAFFNLDYPVSMVVEKDLVSCFSDIPQSTCSPSWDCKTDPVICPPHGYQTRTCIDYNCQSEPIVNQIYCSPGICAGCAVPRWFGDKWGSNKCIPYGFRFEQETDDYSEQIVEYEDSEHLDETDLNGEGSLVVESETKAILTLYDEAGNPYIYTLTPGAEIILDYPGFEEYIKFVLIVDGINYVPDGVSSVDITVKYSYLGMVQEKMDAYCDIDGYVKAQKTPLPDGTWASCQNNYECDSNVCSSGECVEVAQMLREASAFKKTVVRVACRFIHPFSQESYDSCLLDLLG